MNSSYTYAQATEKVDLAETAIFDPQTQLLMTTIPSVLENDFLADPELFLPWQSTCLGNDVELPSFRGGVQFEYDGREYNRGLKRLVGAVLVQIFDGSVPLDELDLEYALSEGTENGPGLFNTIAGVFDHRPGGGYDLGKSALRHIFIGDKNGGLHVPRFSPEAARQSTISKELPFVIPINIGGRDAKEFTTDTSGRKELKIAKKSMFPEGWDNLVIVNAILDAWERRSGLKREDTKDGKFIYDVNFENGRVGDDLGRDVSIRLVTALDHNGEEKIRTAFPLIEADTILN